MWQSINDTGAWRGAGTGARMVKCSRVVLLSAIRDEYARFHYVCVFRCHRSQAREACIQHMAHRDFLTGLPNRILLIDRFRQARLPRNATMVAMPCSSSILIVSRM